VSSFTAHCGTRGCRCTHDDGCVKGWIDNGDTTAPCPVCRWNRQPMPDESRDDWLYRLREQDPAWAAAS
jgi:hypothetical protein